MNRNYTWEEAQAEIEELKKRLEKSFGNCRDCQFWNSGANPDTCYRYPESVRAYSSHGCWEFREKKTKEVVGEIFNAKEGDTGFSYSGLLSKPQHSKL